jgi:hypothetical protein
MTDEKSDSHPTSVSSKLRKNHEFIMELEQANSLGDSREFIVRLSRRVLELDDQLDKLLNKKSEEGSLIPYTFIKRTGIGQKSYVVLPKKEVGDAVSNLVSAISLDLFAKDLIDIEFCEAEVALPVFNEETEKSIYGMWCALSQKNVYTLSFGHMSTPGEKGFSCMLAEAALAYLRNTSGRGFEHLMIPHEFRGSKGNERFLSKLIAMIRKTTTVESNQRLPDLLRKLILMWAESESDFGKSVLFSQKIAWKTVEHNAYSYSTIKKKIKGKIVEISQRLEPFKPTSSPLLQGYEKQAYSYLIDTEYIEKYRHIKDRWSKLSAEKQHECFNDTVIEIKKIHSNQCKVYQQVSAVVGRRVGIYSKLTDKNMSKKDEKNKGKYLADLASAFTKIDLTSIDNEAKLALHPVVPLSGTNLFTRYQQIISLPAQELKEDVNDPRLHALINLEQTWISMYRPQLVKEEVVSPLNIKLTNKFGLLDSSDAV